MGSFYGENIKVSIFGQSHSNAIGVVIDGLPSGIPINESFIKDFLKRRSPAFNPLGTKRKETDSFEILSGVYDGHLCGAPFCAIIKNTDTKPQDYKELFNTPRPSHADFTARMKYKGFEDKTGGGHFSGRLTAPLCIAGAVCMDILALSHIYIGAHIERIGDIWDSRFDPVSVSKEDFDKAQDGELCVINKAAGKEMKRLISSVREDGNSVGGAIECAVIGLPVGVGEPMFYGLENKISAAVFAVPAVKGIEFGSGFDSTGMLGSEHNDSFIIKDGKIKTAANNHGGILGGLSSGMPIIFRTAIKPTPSIAIQQNTVDMEKMENAEISVKGRHDPCIAIRAVPCIEAAAAIAVCDAFLRYKKIN